VVNVTFAPQRRGTLPFRLFTLEIDSLVLSLESPSWKDCVQIPSLSPSLPVLRNAPSLCWLKGPMQGSGVFSS